MNKYLIEILNIQSSVILPGLGALMVPSQKSGKIVFNPHLKFNDGSLARFIADKEGIDEQEAQNKVAKFVREIEAEIGKGNSYDMFEFGNFFKNKDGEVDFKMYVVGGEAVKPAAEKSEDKIEKPAKKTVATPADIIAKDKKETPKKEASKKKTAKASEKKADESKAASEKQTKNKFVPPVVDEAKEKVKAVTEKVEKKAEVVKKAATKKVEKIADKIEQATEKAEKKVEADKEKISDKAAEVKKEVQKKSEKIIPPIISDKKTETSSTEDKQSKNTFVPPTKSVKEKTDSSAAVVAGAAVAAGATIKAGIDAASNDSKAVVKVTEAKATSTIEKTIIKEEKKKRSKLPWIILLLLLIGLAVAGFFYKDQIMAYFDKGDTIVADSTATDTNNNDNSDLGTLDMEDPINDPMETDSGMVEMDSTAGFEEAPIDQDGWSEDPIQEPIEEAPISDEAPAVVSGSNNGSYHLIGNSFGEEANAQRYVTKMQEKGYPAKVLGRFDGLYMVSLKSYDSREDAKAGRSSVSADAGSAWVFKYPK